MKKIFLILIIFIAKFSLITAQNIEIPTSQNPVIIKIAASWCPPCGSWGWDFFDNIYADNEDKSTLLAAHHSGDYQNSTAVDIKENFNVFGQPIFLFDGVDENVVSGNAATKRTAFSTEVTNQSNRNPDVQTGIEATYKDNNLYINYSTKFFNSVSGEYYLGIYVVEKIVVGYQASIGQSAQHKNILREEVSGNSFGNLIASGTIDAQEIYEGSIEVDLGTYNPQNLQIVSIIWKKEGNLYSIVNSNSDKDVVIDNTSTNSEIEKNITSFEIFPTLINHNSTIEVNANKILNKTEVSIYDINGRKLSNIFSGNLNVGVNKINFELPYNLSPSVYFIGLTSENTPNILRKVVVQK